MQRAIEGELNLFLSIRKRNLKQTKLLTIKGQGTTGKHKQTIVAPTKTKGFT